MSSLSRQFRAAVRRIVLGDAYRRLFSTVDGTAVLADLISEAGMLETSQVPGDAHATAFNEGKRAIALFVLDRMRWTEADMVKLAERRAGDARDRMAQEEED